MKVNILKMSQIARCPQSRLDAPHFRPDGSCKCRRAKKHDWDCHCYTCTVQVVRRCRKNRKRMFRVAEETTFKEWRDHLKGWLIPSCRWKASIWIHRYHTEHAR